jgi:hypothetical protein
MKRNAEVGLPRRSLLKSPQPPLLKGEYEDAGVSPPLEKKAGGISFHSRTAQLAVSDFL